MKSSPVFVALLLTASCLALQKHAIASPAERQQRLLQQDMAEYKALLNEEFLSRFQVRTGFAKPAQLQHLLQRQKQLKGQMERLSDLLRKMPQPQENKRKGQFQLLNHL